MRYKPNPLNNLRRAVEFLSKHDTDSRRAVQYLPRFPNARLDGDRIVWTPGPGSVRKPRRSRSNDSFQEIPNNLYLQFAELSEGPDKKILLFAGQWGPLRVRNTSEGEAISDWRYFPRLATALLHAAVDIAGGPRCQQSDWTTISEWAYKTNVPRPEGDKQLLLMGIVGSLNRWYEEPAIHRGLVEVVGGRFGGRIQIQPASDGLIGVLVTQLACVISDTHRQAICTACGRRFIPKRLPSQGRRQYCERKECKQAAQRHAAVDYRQRKKAAIQTVANTPLTRPVRR